MLLRYSLLASQPALTALRTRSSVPSLGKFTWCRASASSIESVGGSHGGETGVIAVPPEVIEQVVCR